ncbi:hypothetical protein [Streptosporangium sp. NPDC000396]|uniref:hypothetical protein n=1 Tax=Streptosporangium sp. NPDC000396 TaxID=3366185 RepID=UPI0036A0F844
MSDAAARAAESHSALHATDAPRDQGTANLLRAAEVVGARRFLAQSFFLGYGYRDHGTEPLTEEHPFALPSGHRAFDRRMRSMRANEEQALGPPASTASPCVTGCSKRPRGLVWMEAVCGLGQDLPTRAAGVLERDAA